MVSAICLMDLHVEKKKQAMFQIHFFLTFVCSFSFLILKVDLEGRNSTTGLKFKKAGNLHLGIQSGLGHPMKFRSSLG